MCDTSSTKCVCGGGGYYKTRFKSKRIATPTKCVCDTSPTKCVCVTLPLRKRVCVGGGGNLRPPGYAATGSLTAAARRSQVYLAYYVFMQYARYFTVSSLYPRMSSSGRSRMNPDSGAPKLAKASRMPPSHPILALTNSGRL